MQKVSIKIPEKNYKVYIGEGYLSKIITSILEEKNYNQITIITDETVKDLYLDEFISSYKEVNTITVPAGEKSKSIDQLSIIYDELAKYKMTRKDLIITLGGGVVGDLGGYAAATYLRGIDYIQVPTTLLSQVDSSVGGKVAVNISAGKNLVGSFYQPKAVYIDTETLNTLDETELKSGLAEVIKYGCIFDHKLFKLLESLTLESLLDHAIDIVRQCIEIKAYYVINDEKENDLRMHLNFGHTLGHAVEKYYKLERFTHGESVAIGIDMINQYTYLLGELQEVDYQRIKALLNRYQYDLDVDIPINDMMDYISRDKKTEGDDVNLILLKHIGESYIKKVSLDTLQKRLEEYLL